MALNQVVARSGFEENIELLIHLNLLLYMYVCGLHIIIYIYT